MEDKRTAYMQSRFKRREGDYYPTIDTRCIDGLLHFFPGIFDKGAAVDMCADMGSSIVDYILALGKPAIAHPDAFADILEDPAGVQKISWGVTNPPYDRSKVLSILEKQVERVRRQTLTDGGLDGFATLMRTAFDHGKSYRKLFESRFYSGQIKLCFRPYWTDERHVMPFHSYVWHIWTKDKRPQEVFHYYPEPDPNYKVIAVGDMVEVTRGNYNFGKIGKILNMEGKGDEKRAYIETNTGSLMWIHPKYLNVYLEEE